MNRAQARRRKGLQAVMGRLFSPSQDAFGPPGGSGPGVVGRFGPFRNRVLVDASIGVVGAVGAAWLLDGLDATFAALWWVATIVVIRSDLRRFIIPDEASAAIAAIGLVHALTASVLAGDGWQDILQVLTACLAAGGSAFAAFWLVAWGFRVASGRDGLGFGDVKLAGACGLWLGFEDQIVALEIASLAAILVLLLLRRAEALRGAAIPFGAFLAPAAWLVFVAGPAVRALIDLHA